MKSWQIAALSFATLGIVSAVLWFATTRDKYAEHMTIETEPSKTTTVVNQTARKFRHVIKQGINEDVLSEWKVTWCSVDTHGEGEFGSCDQADPKEKIIYVSKREGWTDRLRHEIFHALLHETKVTDHHRWLGKHGWCYGAEDCEDEWNPNQE